MSLSDKLQSSKVKSKVKVPDGFWIKCINCGEILQASVLKANFFVCTECNYHFRIGAWDRISTLTTSLDSFKEFDSDFETNDPLKFYDTKSYVERIEAAQKKTNLKDALVTGVGKIDVHNCVIACFDFQFMGGSMGVVVGEKLCRAFEYAIQKRLPIVVVSSSGGARMQEGILSLMQMARTTLLVKKLKEEGLPYISVLTDPTTGGVAASFAMLGDIQIAEPNALVGFAGPRVIQQTMKQALPEGFQRSEFLFKHGLIDAIVHRKEIPQYISKILKILK